MQHNGLTNSEMEMCVWKYGVLQRDLEAASVEDEKQVGLSHQPVPSAEIITYYRKDLVEADKNCTLDSAYCFNMLFLISTTLLY